MVRTADQITRTYYRGVDPISVYMELTGDSRSTVMYNEAIKRVDKSLLFRIETAKFRGKRDTKAAKKVITKLYKKMVKQLEEIDG